MRNYGTKSREQAHLPATTQGPATGIIPRVSRPYTGTASAQQTTGGTLTLPGTQKRRVGHSTRVSGALTPTPRHGIIQDGGTQGE